MPGLELERVPRVPGTRRIFWQYCPAPADYGNFTTYYCVSPLKFEDLLVIGTRFFKFPTQALYASSLYVLYTFQFQ